MNQVPNHLVTAVRRGHGNQSDLNEWRFKAMRKGDYEQILYNLQKDIVASAGRKAAAQATDRFLLKCGELIRCGEDLQCSIECEMAVQFVLSFFQEKADNDENAGHIRALSKMMDIITAERNRYGDRWHAVKRKYSFELFDKFLSLCAKGFCPRMNERHHYYLVDISLNGYIIGHKSYIAALDMIQKLFSCTKKTELDNLLFKKDSCQTKTIYKESVINRKAYWGYLADQRNDPQHNYCQACIFVEGQHSIEDEDNYKKLILNNQDKANAFDLFRFCYIRKKNMCTDRD